LVLSKYFWPIRLAKLLTVQGDSLLANIKPMLPWLVAILALTWAGSVGILPVRGGLTGLAAGSGDAGYWQLAPRSADGLNGGNGGTGPVCGAAVVVAAEPLAGVVVAAVLLLWPVLLLITAITTAATTATATTEPPKMSRIRRIRACFARRSSCRSSLRLAVARRCSLVGTAGMPPWLLSRGRGASSG
jgi:energy-coupling factor transporter transmembrane protein EcfT